MTNQKPRSFEDKPAARERVPLMVGLFGPSGGGKTFSALRLATGIQRVVGGDIYVIDTEARRALHYAPRPGESPVHGQTFSFKHVVFGAPFSPLDYLAAIEHCVAKGARTIIVDSMSHEHEGPGGVLEMHEAECERLMKLWRTNSRDAVQMPAWSAPKQDRRRMINTILQLPCNFIFCFRAKQKTKMPKKGDKDRELKALGFMPIAGEEFVFEMGVCGLLMPGADGYPTWVSDMPGEDQMIKFPGQFRSLLADKQLTEDIGEQLARWSEGGPANAPAAQANIARPAPSGPCFAKTWRPEWAGKPLDSAPSGVLVDYIASMEAVLDDPKKEKAHASVRALLDQAQSVFDATLAEEAMRAESTAESESQQKGNEP